MESNSSIILIACFFIFFFFVTLFIRPRVYRFWLKANKVLGFKSWMRFVEDRIGEKKACQFLLYFNIVGIVFFCIVLLLLFNQE
jgi:hypothetical protein